MSFINVEFLMGHSLGLTQSYYKPIERDVLSDYLKAVDLLTINDDKTTLKKQVAELTEKSREENYVIKGKLAEKEKEMEAATREAEESKKRLEELEAKQEILQANAASVFRALMLDEMGIKSPVEIITWNADKGSEDLFKAAAMARAVNEAREKEHQQRHHNNNGRREENVSVNNNNNNRSQWK
jgi:hypothetical protein